MMTVTLFAILRPSLSNLTLSGNFKLLIKSKHVLIKSF